METFTQDEIIAETVKFYNSHNRAICERTNKCVLLNDEGKMCAFGRCMMSPELNKTGPELNNEDTVVDYLLKPQYRGHPTIFWAKLQELHDDVNFWHETGLTVYAYNNAIPILFPTFNYTNLQ